MAVADDLRQLGQLDVAYLTSRLEGGANATSAITFRGRLRQALDGNWVFNTFVGQNGVIGINLGQMSEVNWSSEDTPAGGLQISITHFVIPPGSGSVAVIERIVLASVIPQDLAE